MNQNRTVAGRTIQAMVVGCIIAGSTSAVMAAAIGGIAINSGQTMIFDDSLGSEGEWTVPAASHLGGTLFTSPPGAPYFINPSSAGVFGTMSWTGHGLDQDLTPLGGRAEATFLGGGTFTLRGRLYNVANVPLTPADTILLTGSVGAFGVLESDLQPDALNQNPGALFIPSGGALYGGLFDQTNFIINFTSTRAEQESGHLVDFQSTITAVTALQVTLVATSLPEPSSLILLIAGVAAGVVRRRRN